MKKGLKLALISSAFAAVVVSAPLVFVPSYAGEAQQLELTDGTKITVDGGSVLVVGADGSTHPAPDGVHVTKDGQSITTKDGKIVE